MRRGWVGWLLVFAAWTALAVFFAVSSSLTYMSTYQPPRWGLTLVMALTEWYAWAALTPLVVWLAERFPLRAGRIGRAVAVHGPGGLVVAAVKIGLTRGLRHLLVGFNSYFLISNLATHYVIYWAIVGAVHALAYYRAGREGELRASQLEARLAQARLQLLQMQLHPHFLFNTLNAVSELIHEEPARADRMIASLSELLRETLDAGSPEQVALERELELLDRYLDIQRARFGDRLDVRIDVGGAARRALVPNLILQPLVENSIRHGLSRRVAAGRIDIRGARVGDSLILEVQDDGLGLEGAAREGVGLGNTRARLQELYGDAHRVEIRDADGGGALVRLAIPWLETTAGRRESTS
jgi:two-component system, LytTR family, sensor kinase